ncbi:hypothetical protein [Chitinophaga barathri]|uniref:MFS transporter n=1 Tax=Chitinophaga barathri TaxID=1647451 RepID=A0A3N4MVM8_9BACT|nr:hypothetical protein [Chitinophaga barathri]RPD39443.1 hypothetical protein EG028_20185 [Chitinophaga barathri]
MNTGQRLTAPTPPLFQKVRNIGLLLTAISTAIIGLPVALPLIITQVAGYVALAGAVMTGVSQATVENEGG